MRSIKYLVVHCTATPQNARVETILRYWREKLGWKNPGYHKIIDRNGSITTLLPPESNANGVAGFNAVCLHVSYIGGAKLDNRTEAQKNALIEVLTEWRRQYPNAVIQGHRDFPNVKKACPQFDAKAEYQNLGR